MSGTLLGICHWQAWGYFLVLLWYFQLQWWQYQSEKPHLQALLYPPTQLASLAGISYPTLYKIENGQTTTHVYIRAVLSALSEKLGRVIKESDVNGLAII